MDFYDKLFKNCHFQPQKEPKGPKGPIETPQDHENNFFELPGYENPMLEKKILNYLPQEKSWFDHVPSAKIDITAIDLGGRVMEKISV